MDERAIIPKASTLLDKEKFARGADLTTTVVTANNTFIENNTELTQAYLRAHLEAIDFTENNNEGVAQNFADHIEEITSNALDSGAGYIPSNDIEGLVTGGCMDVGLTEEYNQKRRRAIMI